MEEDIWSDPIKLGNTQYQLNKTLIREIERNMSKKRTPMLSDLVLAVERLLSDNVSPDDIIIQVPFNWEPILINEYRQTLELRDEYNLKTICGIPVKYFSPDGDGHVYYKYWQSGAQITRNWIIPVDKDAFR